MSENSSNGNGSSPVPDALLRELLTSDQVDDAVKQVVRDRYPELVSSGSDLSAESCELLAKRVAELVNPVVSSVLVESLERITSDITRSLAKMHETLKTQGDASSNHHTEMERLVEQLHHKPRKSDGKLKKSSGETGELPAQIKSQPSNPDKQESSSEIVEWVPWYERLPLTPLETFAVAAIMISLILLVTGWYTYIPLMQ